MRKSLAFVALTAALAAAPAALRAQASPPDSVTLRAAVETLKSHLRNFVTAQENYYAHHNKTYATSLREMGTAYQASAGVILVLLTSSRESHSEIVITDRVPGLVCAVWVGNSPPPLGMGREGEAVCRGP